MVYSCTLFWSYENLNLRVVFTNWDFVWGLHCGPSSLLLLSPSSRYTVEACPSWPAALHASTRWSNAHFQSRNMFCFCPSRAFSGLVCRPIGHLCDACRISRFLLCASSGSWTADFCRPSPVMVPKRSFSSTLTPKLMLKSRFRSRCHFSSSFSNLKSGLLHLPMIFQIPEIWMFYPTLQTLSWIFGFSADRPNLNYDLSHRIRWSCPLALYLYLFAFEE